MTPKQLVKRVVIGVVAFIALIIFFSSFTTVKSGEKAVVLHWGAYEGKVLEPGLHWLNPFSENIVKMDTTIVKEESQAEAATKDQQLVNATIAVNYRIDSDKAGEIYVSLKREADERVVRPSIQEAVKAATAKYTAEELITKRSLVSEDITKNISAKLAESHLVVTGVNIINLAFSKSFNDSIEKKVTAEQDALASKNKLEQSKYEAEQRVVQARGEAEAIKIQAAAIQSQGGAEYVQLQAITKWNGVGCTNNCFGSNTQMPVPFLNVR